MIHLLNRLPKTMSGGESQRIALGRALIRTPNLFLLDEPVSSLDAMLRIELRAELKRLQRYFGHTFLLAAPDFHEAMAVADTVIMLRQGRVVQIARPQELYDKPLDRDIATFVGSPQINLIEAKVVPDTRGEWIEAADARIRTPPLLRSVFAAGLGAFVLGIRPKNLELAEPSEVDINGELIDIEPLGLKSVLTVRDTSAEFRLHMESTKTRGLSVHQNLGLKPIHPSKLLAFESSSGKLVNP